MFDLEFNKSKLNQQQLLDIEKVWILYEQLLQKDIDFLETEISSKLGAGHVA